MPAADLYRTLWRRRWMILAATALAGVAAYVFSSSQPKVYEATALVRVQQSVRADESTFGSVNSLELGQRLAQTYARIVETRSMVTRVATSLVGVVPIEDISISAAPDLNVELLEISAQSQSPQVAATVANATTVGLKKFISETGTLRDQIVVVDRATVPVEPVSPRPKLAAALVVLIALLVNFALALALELFSDRLPEIDEFEERFGRPVLATIPVLTLRHRAESTGAVVPAPRGRPPSATPAPVTMTGGGSPGTWSPPTTVAVEPRRGRGN
jgi:capsular polysaccharide biosynthesis protein